MNGIHGTANYRARIYNAVTRIYSTVTCKLQHHGRNIHKKVLYQKKNTETPLQFSVTNTACFYAPKPRAT